MREVINLERMSSGPEEQSPPCREMSELLLLLRWPQCEWALSSTLKTKEFRAFRRESDTAEIKNIMKQMEHCTENSSAMYLPNVRGAKS